MMGMDKEAMHEHCARMMEGHGGHGGHGGAGSESSSPAPVLDAVLPSWL